MEGEMEPRSLKKPPKSALETVGQTQSVKIPHWPYEKWKFTEIAPREEEIAVAKVPMVPTHDIPEVIGKGFVAFLKSFSHQMNVYNQITCIEILNQITTMLKETLNELVKTHKCFEKCRLVQAGSIAEKSKIQAPDEFDFLIILDYFSNKELFQIVVKKDVLRIYVKDPAVMDLLPFNSKTLNHSLAIDRLLRLKIMELFIHEFDKRIPTGWRRKQNEEDTESDENKLCCSSVASTLHLVNEKFHLNIDVDLCLCLPISANEFKGALFIPEDINPHHIQYFNNQLLVFTHLKNILQEQSLELFAMLGKADNFNDGISTRIIVPQKELAYFLPLSPNEGRLKTYCIAKCILSAFLPQLTKIFGCKSCCHKLVRSYHIKNIFFFMLNNYKENLHWEEDQVPRRVFEIFSILKECMITDDESSCDAAISTYSLPGSLYLENVTNFSPYNESEFFFTPDSHKPVYQLSSSPVYEKYLRTDDKTEKMLMEWFKKLNTKPWNSRQLLHDLFDLLKTINEMT